MGKFLSFLKDKLFPKTEYELAVQSSDTFIEYLRGKGISIGQSCTFYTPSTHVLDLTRPELISIGDNVKIARNSTFLTHGFDWCVLRELYQERAFGSAGEIVLGNNIFVGANSTLLKGVKIGENSVVGAGSVVTGSFPENSVLAGNPAKRIMSIDDLYEKYKKRQVEEAKLYARKIYEKRNRLPAPSDFREFFFLFMGADEAEQHGINVKKQVSEKYMDEFKVNHSPTFNGFNEFLKYCGLLK